MPGSSQESAKRKEKIFSFAACRIRKASYLCNPKQNEGCWHPKQMAPDRKGEKSFGQKKKNAELWQPQQRVINKRAAGSFKLDTREPKEGEELLILRCFRKKRQSLRLWKDSEKNLKKFFLRYCKKEKSSYLCTPETKETVFRLLQKRKQHPTISSAAGWWLLNQQKRKAFGKFKKFFE